MLHLHQTSENHQAMDLQDSVDAAGWSAAVERDWPPLQTLLLQRLLLHSLLLQCLLLFPQRILRAMQLIHLKCRLRLMFC